MFVLDICLHNEITRPAVSFPFFEHAPLSMWGAPVARVHFMCLVFINRYEHFDAVTFTPFCSMGLTGYSSSHSVG